MNGYFVLASNNLDARGSPPMLPRFIRSFFGKHLGERDYGQWVLDTPYEAVTLNIPSRDKRVQIWTNMTSSEFVNSLATIDSHSPGLAYKQKLAAIAADVPHGFVGFVNNVNSDTHSSLAMVCKRNVFLYGLHELASGHSYILWSNDSSFLDSLLSLEKDRFLLYRFAPFSCLFIPSESICSKWRRWNSTSNLLQAFNALERRICGT